MEEISHCHVVRGPPHAFGLIHVDLLSLGPLCIFRRIAEPLLLLKLSLRKLAVLLEGWSVADDGAAVSVQLHNELVANRAAQTANKDVISYFSHF